MGASWHCPQLQIEKGERNAGFIRQEATLDPCCRINAGFRGSAKMYPMWGGAVRSKLHFFFFRALEEKVETLKQSKPINSILTLQRVTPPLIARGRAPRTLVGAQASARASEEGTGNSKGSALKKVYAHRQSVLKK